MVELVVILPAAVLAVVSNDGYEAPVADVWPSFLCMFYAVVFAVLICACAFKDARRSHLD